MEEAFKQYVQAVKAERKAYAEVVAAEYRLIELKRALSEVEDNLLIASTRLREAALDSKP